MFRKNTPPVYALSGGPMIVASIFSRSQEGTNEQPGMVVVVVVVVAGHGTSWKFRQYDDWLVASYIIPYIMRNNKTTNQMNMREYEYDIYDSSDGIRMHNAT